MRCGFESHHGDNINLKTKNIMSSLKRIGGKYYSQSEVVMVTTKNPSPLKIDLNGDLLYKSFMDYDDDVKFQHLYFLSDDKIEVGHWFYNFFIGVVMQATTENLSGLINPNSDGSKRIIATTDPELNNISISDGEYFDSEIKKFSLPQPSDSFIKKYVEEYRKGKPIEKVLIEFKYKIDKSMGHFHQVRRYFLKVDDGNYITIKKKQNKVYSEDEVQKLLNELYDVAYQHGQVSIGGGEEKISYSNWLKENL